MWQVGRTKIITLHSGVWLENRTDRRVAFRLHVPITPLVAPAPEQAPPSDVAAGSGATGAPEFKSDATIGPLPPGEGAHCADPYNSAANNLETPL